MSFRFPSLHLYGDQAAPRAVRTVGSDCTWCSQNPRFWRSEQHLPAKEATGSCEERRTTGACRTPPHPRSVGLNSRCWQLYVMQVNARALDSLDFCGSAHTHARLERIVQSHPLYLNEAEALHTWRSGGDTPGHGSGRVCGSDVSLTQPPLWLLRKFAEVVRQNFDHRSRNRRANRWSSAPRRSSGSCPRSVGGGGSRSGPRGGGRGEDMRHFTNSKNQLCHT